MKRHGSRHFAFVRYFIDISPSQSTICVVLSTIWYLSKSGARLGFLIPYKMSWAQAALDLSLSHSHLISPNGSTLATYGSLSIRINSETTSSPPRYQNVASRVQFGPSFPIAIFPTRRDSALLSLSWYTQLDNLALLINATLGNGSRYGSSRGQAKETGAWLRSMSGNMLGSPSLNEGRR